MWIYQAVHIVEQIEHYKLHPCGRQLLQNQVFDQKVKVMSLPAIIDSFFEFLQLLDSNQGCFQLSINYLSSLSIIPKALQLAIFFISFKSSWTANTNLFGLP